jgi:hypothetical protein
MGIDKEQAMKYLTQWQQQSTPLGAYLAVPRSLAGVTMLAQITEVSVRIVLTNGSAILRFSLQNARFEYGPLRILALPSKLGPAVAVSHAPQGLLPRDGLHIRLESGPSLFLCDIHELGQNWLALVASSMDETGFLGP